MKNLSLRNSIKTLFVLFGIIISNYSFGLVTSYTFSQSAGTYTAISGGTVLGDTTNDDDTFNGLNIGFTFYFNGQPYTTFGVNTNGYIGFGNFLVSSQSVISSGFSTNVISALNYDLEGQVGSEIQYTTTGAAPNRVLVVQWTKYRDFGATGDNLNFQIRLSETTNNIDIKYGTMTSVGVQASQTGIKGGGNTDFSNRYVSDTVNTWATSVAGDSINDVCVLTAAFRPNSGQTYSWQPPPPPAVPTNLTFTNITTTSITLNWTDNSTTETSFLVYKSTDNVIFTLVNTVASTSTATTGTSYPLLQSGLISATTYYFRIYAVGITPSATSLNGNSTTLAGTICGTSTIGPTGTYPSITAAIAALQSNGLSCPVILELQPAYLSSVDAFPIVIPFLGSNAARSLTLRPAAGAVNLKLISDSSRCVDLNGATWFNIDGRAGGTGTTINLTLIDSLTTGNVVRFINDAQNNGLNYVGIQGSTRGSTTNGVIQFSNGATTTANSNNTISNCDITKLDTMPQVMIYSNTNTGTNSSNTITNNKIHDWLSPGGTNYGINLGANNASWTISGNSFYQTVAQTYTGNSTHAAINIAGGGGPGGGSSGNGFIMSGNFIGGSAPSCGGTAWTINGNGSPRFNGISINVGTTSASEIQGNTIRNISLTTPAAGGGPGGGATIFNGINISGGNVNVGTTTPNNIGSNTSNNSIQTFGSATGAQTNGINSSSGGTVAISGNIIGGINANDSALVNTTTAIGILVSAGTVSITNNQIGSSTMANSIVNAASAGTGASQVTGISSSNTNTCTISGNTIKNISNNYQGASGGTVRGIATSGGVNTVTGNTVELLTNYSSQSGTNGNASVLGISQTSTSQGHTISNNVIKTLSNKTGTGNVVLTGIYYSGSINGTNIIEKNRINGLSAASDTSVASINGIQINGGRSKIANNMICLGSDTSGNAYTTSNEYTGILKTTTGSNNFYFNSINISGTGVNSRVVNTYSFRRTSTGLDTLKNNIFFNGRSNATAGGSHYSISLNNDSTTFSGKNDLYGTGSGYLAGVSNGTNANSLFGWFSLTHLDSNSFSLNPNFQSVNNLHINITNPSGLESKGYVITGTTVDIDGDVRPGPAGSTHGGATAPDIGADEFDGTPVVLDMGVFALARPTNGCHSATDSVSVTIKNFATQTINFVTNPLTLNVSATGFNPFVFPPVTINTGTLAAGATMNVFITNAYNMSSPGTYSFHAYAVTTGDIFPNNDTLPQVNIVISSGVAGPSLSSICAGLPVTLSVTGQTAGSTLQWQVSTNHTTWTNIAGATSTSTIVTPTATRFYRVVGCGIFNSNIDTVNVTSVANPTTTGATRCGAGQVTLHATSPNNIVWFDSTSGGSVVDTGAAFTTIASANRSYYAAANGNVSAPKNLTTLISGPNASGGIMFTISAINNLNITGFDCQADSGVNTWRIYYRKDNFINVPNANTSSNGWILVDSVSNVISAGAGALTSIPISMSVLVPAGKTYSFYVMETSGPNVIYSIGTGAGNVNTSNADLQVRDGFAGQTFNCQTSPRVFNGTVRYRTSCLSTRIAANITVTSPPAINAIASTGTVCEGDSISLQATSGNSNYRYTWTPTTDLSDSTGATVWAHPSSSTTYILHALDSVTGCANLDTVAVSIYQKPTVNVSANNDSVCEGDTLNLNANIQLSYNIGNGNNSNGPTTYPAPYGNSSFGARHQILILASEMQGAGMVPGYINSLSFNVANLNNGGALTNFTVKIGNTVRTALTDTFQTTPMTTVFTSPSYTPTANINAHAFTAPFHWNGTSNILIETCFNNATATENASIRRNITQFVSCTYYHADSANNCSKTIGSSANMRPNIRLGIRNQYSVRWISNQHLSDSLSVTPYSVPTVSDVYYVTVTDTITGCTNTDSLHVTVDDAPTVSLGPDTNACGHIILDAGNPGDTYLWNDSTQNQILQADTSGQYYVTVTHLFSCFSSDTINVTIIPPPAVALALAFDSICTGDGVQILSGGTPAGGTYSGAGVSGNIFNPVTAGAGPHLIGYSFTDTATDCSNTVFDTVRVSICAGISGIDGSELIRVFPNPVNNELNVDLSGIKEKCILEIMTPDAKVISFRTFAGNAVYPIRVENLAAGIYFLRINTASSNYIIRFIKQN